MRTLRYRHALYRLAVDGPVSTPEPPTETEMVQQVEDKPVDDWRRYLQPIIRTLRQQLGLDHAGAISLLTPVVRNPFGSPDLGFTIDGFVRVQDPLDEQKFGKPPYKFSAKISPEGDLMVPVEFVGVVQP